ncbi:MAG: sensor domain-containing diguanylate cyclase [Parvibaculaceae bacterium]|nr:sensor domain-containing diguanylate cyclase [Parvibaculaceae bacterium]
MDRQESKTGASEPVVLSANMAARQLFEIKDDFFPQPLSLLFTERTCRQLAPLLIPHGSGAHQAFPFEITSAYTPEGKPPIQILVQGTPVDMGSADWLLTISRTWQTSTSLNNAMISQQNIIEALNFMPVAVEIYDRDLKEIFSNDHSDRMFGYGPGEVSGLDDWWELGYPDPEYRQLARKAWYDAMDTSRATNHEILMKDWVVACKDGTSKIIQFRYRSIGDLHVFVFWDISEQRRLEENLRQLANTDTLTGLFNRRSFFERLALSLENAKTSGIPVSLMMLDLDHFKSVNDIHGHSAGDATLREVARRCQKLLRDGDSMGRIGGEEFAILLPSSDHKTAAGVAERLRLSVSSLPIVLEGANLNTSVSIGLSTSLPGETDMFGFVKRADQALYAAKAAGRDCVRPELA